MENSQFYLGIETSGRCGSIAVFNPEQQIVQLNLQQQGRKHAQTLVAEVKNLLDQLKITPNQVSGVGVSRGPGSFTGLRIGITFAKTFGYITGSPVLGIDTFEAIALNCPPEVNETYIISNAQRGDLFVGKYSRISDNEWQNTSEITLIGQKEFCHSLKPNDTISGTGIDLLDRSSLSNYRMLDQTYQNPTAEKIALITARILQKEPSTQYDPPNETWGLTPFYIRKSAAEEKWDAEKQPNHK